MVTRNYEYDENGYMDSRCIVRVEKAPRHPEPGATAFTTAPLQTLNQNVLHKQSLVPPVFRHQKS